MQKGSVTVIAVDELSCDHEECDTHIFLHVKHTAKDYQNVIIRSPDTEVAVIGISLKSQLPVNLHFSSGVGNQSCITDLEKVISILDPNVCTFLIGLHRVTDCDFTSVLYGKRKRKACGLRVKGFLMFSQTLGNTSHLKANIPSA